ncbi:MAG: CDP-glycerol glycerophosphotransferase family protein [Vicinamibacterales bacterium]
MNLVRRLTKQLHVLDHGIGRLSARRRLLVEMRTPVYQAVLGPVCEAIADQITDASIFYTSEYPDRIRPLVGPTRFLTHAQVEWTRFDLYLNADPWAAARLRRCARRINFFHGVAGKYDLDRPVGLPMGFECYDRVAFINRDRMQRYLDAKLVTDRQAALVGYPKLDRLATGSIDVTSVRESLGFNNGRPLALYAPTYSPASSLHLAGADIIQALASIGFNVVIKLHDRSFDSDPRYTGGIDWRERMRALEREGRVRLTETPDASPLLAAADLMVTDHSSVGFEYLVVDRPLLIFDAPGLIEAARINPEKVALLRSAATVVTTVDQLIDAAREAVATPDRLSAVRRRIAGDLFFEPGSATGRALELVREMLHPHASSFVKVRAESQRAGGRIA